MLAFLVTKLVTLVFFLRSGGANWDLDSINLKFNEGTFRIDRQTAELSFYINNFDLTRNSNEIACITYQQSFSFSNFKN